MTNPQQERTNILKEIDKLKYHKDHATCPECNLCGTCETRLKPLEARLSQHDKTMKLVMEEIDKPYGIDKLDISKSEKINLAMFLIAYKSWLKKSLGGDK